MNSKRKINKADAIIFSYPVYTFLAPSQLHRFIELVKENNVKKYYMTANVRFVDSDVESITLYLVNIGKDGQTYVNEELSETVNITENSSYHFMTQFKNNKQKYQIEMKLKFI